jgi:hypothetical protein
MTPNENKKQVANIHSVRHVDFAYAIHLSKLSTEISGIIQKSV